MGDSLKVVPDIMAGIRCTLCGRQATGVCMTMYSYAAWCEDHYRLVRNNEHREFWALIALAEESNGR